MLSPGRCKAALEATVRPNTEEKKAVVGFKANKGWLHGPSKGGHGDQYESVENHGRLRLWVRPISSSGGRKSPKVDYLQESYEKVMGLQCGCDTSPVEN